MSSAEGKIKRRFPGFRSGVLQFRKSRDVGSNKNPPLEQGEVVLGALIGTQRVGGKDDRAGECPHNIRLLRHLLWIELGFEEAGELGLG
ncbi:hypothetical protein IIC65_03900 [Candidatus Sumerlaeota bacterium]|nr:hypothetical protein [Candidatus Sumerlaeota bacterium]